MGCPRSPPCTGCTCRLGLGVWKALHACRAGKSVPVPEAGPPQPAQAGGSPQSAFVPALERMDWRQPGSAVSGDTGDPRVRQREGGQVEGWTDGRTDEAAAGSSALVRPGPVPAVVALAGPAYAAHVVPAPGCDHPPWRCSHSPWDTVAGPGPKLVPPSPGSSATGHRGAGMGVLALLAGDGELGEWILQWVSQPHAAQGVGCRIWFIPSHGVPALLSCFTPSCLCMGHKPGERGMSRAHGRCPALGAQPRLCHGAPIRGHPGAALPQELPPPPFPTSL